MEAHKRDRGLHARKRKAFGSVGGSLGCRILLSLKVYLVLATNAKSGEINLLAKETIGTGVIIFIYF